MLKKFHWFLIAGGILWIVLWSAHTVAHGPLNPAPETGRFLGRSSMFYAAWTMFLTPVPLALGWAGFHRFAAGGWSGVRWAGVMSGIAGLLVTFIAGCAGMIAFIRQGFTDADLGPVWYIGVPGQLLMLAGTLLFGMGFLTAKNFGILVRIVPLAVALLIPFLTYLRSPGSPLLESGPVAGYLLLESVGALFGICWIVLGLGSLRRIRT